MKYLLPLLFCFNSFAQDLSYKGDFFFYWGYNRANYSKSDIHFSGDGYDFIIKEAKATDRPTSFDRSVYFNPRLFTIPQYVYRVGYFIRDNISLSVGMDHMKYVLKVPENYELEGVISPVNSKDHAGTYNNQTVYVDRKMLEFEHSDGLNYLSAEIDYHVRLAELKMVNITIDGIAGLGVGAYIPKTKVALFGEVVDNKFHLSGYGGSMQVMSRITFKAHLFLNFGVKSGWSFLPDVFVVGSADRANHNFGFFEYFGSVGGQFTLPGKSSGKKDQVKEINN